jgi:hypothetical protein
MSEDYIKDSDMIFKALTSGGFTSSAEAEQALVMLCV